MRKSSATINNESRSTELEIRKEIGRRIAEMRSKLGLTARLVAKELHVSREAITHIETGRNNISAVSLWELATLFHCDIADFFPDIPNGYSLTRVDINKVAQMSGKTGAAWAEKIFGKKK
ncbi:MAG TPA: helix-turn-helix transcriptional regulator [Candidatus Paceibacterota bacterium]|nr:helix-turn-helix transcriptional regulator [Candidatus Paceibacterota bacterium]